MFSYEFCEIFQETSFVEYLQTAASDSPPEVIWKRKRVWKILQK